MSAGTLARQYSGYIPTAGALKMTRSVECKHVEKNTDRMSQFHMCKQCMLKPSRGFIEDYRDGDKVLKLDDLDTDFILSVDGFYWNFFDGCFVDRGVVEWADGNIDLDRLQFNERNLDCLKFVYPRLTSRARLFGGSALSMVLRDYKDHYTLDTEKLACQLIGMTDLFAEEFHITEDMIHPMEDETSISPTEAVKVVTSRNIETCAEYLRNRFKGSFDVKECDTDGDTKSTSADSVRPVFTSGAIMLFSGDQYLSRVDPGDCLNIERHNTYLIKTSEGGTLSHFLKISSEEVA